MSMLATVTRSGRAAFAAALAAQPLHLAWGTGLEEWDDPETEEPALYDAESLVNEVGRRLASQVGFVVPDESGDIIIPTGIHDGQIQESRYQLSPTPTPHLYVRVAYEFGDAANLTIRELALFSGTQIKPELPPGQRYFLPGDLADPGIMVAVQILRPPLQRSPSVRQTEEFVLSL